MAGGSTCASRWLPGRRLRPSPPTRGLALCTPRGGRPVWHETRSGAQGAPRRPCPTPGAQLAPASPSTTTKRSPTAPTTTDLRFNTPHMPRDPTQEHRERSPTPTHATGIVRPGTSARDPHGCWQPTGAASAAATTHPPPPRRGSGESVMVTRFELDPPVPPARHRDGPRPVQLTQMPPGESRRASCRPDRLIGVDQDTSATGQPKSSASAWTSMAPTPWRR